MDWKGKSVFITGANGFIGGWVTKELVAQGANVVVVVRDATAKDKSALDIHGIRESVSVVQGDIADYELMQRIMNEYDVEYVFHIAAQPLVGVANKNPMSTFETNIKGTWCVLEAARNTETIKGVVVTSSDKAYGNQKELPYTEDMHLNGLYPYDVSKVCTDVLAQSYAVSYDLPVAVTRKANIYGGADMNFSRIVPDAVVSMLHDKPLVIRSDGTLERDYMYIKDAVQAYLLLAEKVGEEGVKGEAFNFGLEKPISVLELVKTVNKVGGKDIAPKVMGTAKNEIDRQYLGSAKAKKILGWEPKYSLEEGLKETITWYKAFLEK